MSLSISNFRKLPIAFLGSILLFLAIFIIQSVLVESEVFWRFCYLYGPPGGGAYLDAELRAMPQITGQKRIFLTGSSQTQQGFDMKYLNSEFEGVDTAFYNVAISNGQAIDIFMIRDKLLARKPNTIIYLPQLGSFYSEYDFRKMQYYFDPQVLPYMLKYLGLGRTIAQREYFVNSFISEMSTLYKHRQSIQTVLANAIEVYRTVGKRTEPEPYFYKENKPSSYFKAAILKANRNQYHVTPYTELSKELFILFAKDVVSEGVQLIVISAPTNPLIKETYKEELDVYFNNFLLDQSEKIGFVYLSENQLPSFTEEDFIDFLHLNTLGRSKLSRFLKRYLEEDRNPSFTRTTQ